MQCPCCLSKTRRQLLGIMAATAGGLLVTRLSPASAAPIKKVPMSGAIGGHPCTLLP